MKRDGFTGQGAIRFKNSYFQVKYTQSHMLAWIMSAERFRKGEEYVRAQVVNISISNSNNRGGEMVNSGSASEPL